MGNNQPLGMVFPMAGALRHPSQLYEAFFEGIILFIILVLSSKVLRSRTHISYLLLDMHDRFVLEFTREPDAQLGH